MVGWLCCFFGGVGLLFDCLCWLICVNAVECGLLTGLWLWLICAV